MNQKFYALEQSNDGTATIHLYDEVGAFGAGSKDFLAELAKLNGQHIHLRINSPGGSVVEGTAIYNALRRHQGGLTVHIDALAASMASVIAMSGSPVFIADNALLMIHNPWTVSAGDSEQLRKEADLLDKLKSTLVNAYTRKTGMDQAQIAEMMDNETWLDAVEAVALGFADAIEEGVAAAATATPEMLRARFDKFAKAQNTMNQTEILTYSAEDSEKATVVSESAPAEHPAVEPIHEVAPEPTPAEPAPEVVESSAVEAEPVAEPQAKIAMADAILAKYNAAIAERDAIRAELIAAKGQLAQEREALARLESSLGLAPARVVPVIDPVAEPANIYDQWKSATGAEKTRIFRANRKALEAHIKASGI